MSTPRSVLFFDIDNCVRMTMNSTSRLLTLILLYSQAREVREACQESIDRFFQNALSLSPDAAHELQTRYNNEQLLLVEAAARYHGIDPFFFNSQVDDALPLERLLAPDPNLRKMLQSLDRGSVKPWLLTNAYVNHAQRVVRLLGVDDQFEGLTYCDYGAASIVCKPAAGMFMKAMHEAGVDDPSACFYVDDSLGHCLAAEKVGWTAVHLDESAEDDTESLCKYRISNLLDLKKVFPQFFTILPASQ